MIQVQKIYLHNIDNNVKIKIYNLFIYLNDKKKEKYIKNIYYLFICFGFIISIVNIILILALREFFQFIQTLNSFFQFQFIFFYQPFILVDNVVFVVEFNPNRNL